MTIVEGTNGFIGNSAFLKRYNHFSEILSKGKERRTVHSSFHEANVSFIPESDEDVPTEESGRPVSFMNIVNSSILRKNSLK